MGRLCPRCGLRELRSTAGWCYSCVNEHNRSTGARDRARERKVELVRAKKSLPCVDCGRSFPPEVMDLDHVPERGPKLFKLSETGRMHISWAALRAELAKCDQVDPLCHRLRTLRRAGIVIPSLEEMNAPDNR